MNKLTKLIRQLYGFDYLHLQTKYIYYFYDMFSDIKRIKIVEIEKELEQLKVQEHAMYAELCNLTNQLSDYERKLLKMEWQNQNGMGAFYAKRFSVYERMFNKKTRNEYRIYRNKVKELNSLPDEIAILINRIDNVRKKTIYKIAESGIEQKIMKVQCNLLKTKNATTLSELGITPTEAKKTLGDNGIVPAIDKDDRIIAKHLRTFMSTMATNSSHENSLSR